MQNPSQLAPIIMCESRLSLDSMFSSACTRPLSRTYTLGALTKRLPVLVYRFRVQGDAHIPIAPRSEDPQAYEAAFREAAQVLREGDLLGIFPEGGITRNGSLQPFKGGIIKILEQAQADGLPDVRVIPMALTNLWGSYFSRIELRNGEPTAMVQPFRRGWLNAVGLNVGEALPAHEVSLDSLRERVLGLSA